METSPLGQDGLAHPWPDHLLYAIPPFPLIGVSLHRIQQGNHRLLLVAPNWPGRPWFVQATGQGSMVSAQEVRPALTAEGPHLASESRTPAAMDMTPERPDPLLMA